MRKFLFLILTLTAFACGDENSTTPTPGFTSTGYYPLEIGRFVEYNVMEVQFAATLPPDTTYSQMREVITDTFTDVTGQKAWRVQQYVKNNNGRFWLPDSVVSVRQEGGRIIRTESNNPFIRLVLPVREGTSWDGNALQAKGPEQYEYRNLGQPYTLNDTYF